MVENPNTEEWGEAAEPLRLTISTPAEAAPVSARLVEVGLRFGVPLVVPGREVTSNLPIVIRPGTITLVTGPSGAGKSLLLAGIARKLPAARLVQNIAFPNDVAVLDAVAPTRPVDEALSILTACGLGEPTLWIRRFGQLSDGEQFRARLARAISLHRRGQSKAQDDDDSRRTAPLLCDEFGAILHRRLAKALAFNLRKLVRREKLALVVATSQNDLDEDLHADTTIRLGGAAPIVEHATLNKSADVVSVARQLRIQRGTLADYAEFSAMHYRQRGQVGFVDKVFVCREGLDGPALGVVVYAHPTLELKLRNQITHRKFCRNAQRLNKELRLLKRLVVHPDIRGCGIAHWLVRRTLPLVGTRFVECLATMGAVNPVFEKAGMRRIGLCEPPASRDASLAQLRAAGVDPLSADFISHVCRRPAVRRIVARCVLNWYRATCSNSDEKLSRQTATDLARTFRQLIGSQPVYYIWAADQAGWSLIDRHARQQDAIRDTVGCDATGPRRVRRTSKSAPGAEPMSA